MSHHHDHSHDHAHGHPHDHHHDHTHDDHQDHTHGASGTLSFEEKMSKLLEHWIKHNDDHADSYRDWAQKASAEDMKTAAHLLVEVAELTGQITGKFQQALATIKK